MDRPTTPDPARTAGRASAETRSEAARSGVPEESPWERSGTPQTVEDAEHALELLRHEVAERNEQIKQHEDQLLRVRAELENFKRRIQREKSEALRYANEPLLRDLLPVIDNLERALSAAANLRTQSNGESGSPFEALVSGVEMVLASFRDVLGRHGVSRLATAGEPFDPSRHEALAQVETSAQAPGTVVEEYAPGYTLHDRLLRAAQVTVAKNPTQKSG